MEKISCPIILRNEEELGAKQIEQENAYTEALGMGTGFGKDKYYNLIRE
jgi:hypothetical protein